MTHLPTDRAAAPGSRAAAPPAARPVIPATGPRRGIALGELQLTSGFWGDRQQVNAEATIRHCLDWMERLGWVANFDRVASGRTDGERPGWQFSDSEVYKLLEALAWEHGRTADPVVDEAFGALVARIAAAQDEDGYLNTCYGHAGQAPRYSDLSSGHELYCTGHLLQAAVARLRTGGDDLLVEVARRAADHVCREFGPAGRQGVCGHPEIELGLAELGRALGEPRYLDQARLFVERRGHGTLEPIALLSPSYFQDDVPVRDADAWRGHAVRALYLAAGAVDVAVDTGDDELLAAVRGQWDRSVARRTYLTGGMGSRHQDEGFGDDWELPSDRAYCETCAGVASAMVSWRLYLATGKVEYADLMERTFYNVIATSPRADGRAFFYANPLQQRVAGADVRPDEVNPRAEGGVRAPWFDVSCCPTNVARTLASWHAYAASVEDDTLTLLQYAAGDLRVALAGGDELAVRVHTSYPTSGRVRVEVLAAPPRAVGVRLRVPHWADGASLTEPGLPARRVEPGWATVSGELVAGQEIVLDLPVEPRFTWPDPRVDAVRGSVAVERGPLVLCLESFDLPPGATMDDVRLDAATPARAHDDGALVDLAVVGAGRGAPGPVGTEPVGTEPDGAGPADAGPASGPAFGPRPASPTTLTRVEVPFVPYHRWAERGPATMRVFVPAL